jgi:putative hemin transport protein
MSINSALKAKEEKSFGFTNIEEVKKIAAKNNQSENKILSDYTKLKTEKPQTRPYDACKQLGISEAQLIASRIDGETILRLDATEVENIFARLHELEEVTCITRNDACVHERKGKYTNVSFFNAGPTRMGLAVNPDIDTRLFMTNWGKVFAVAENARGSVRKSIQFFGNDGLALHKVYLNNNSNEQAYEKIILDFASTNQSFNETTTQKQKANGARNDSEVDIKAFEAELTNLKDTHDYFILLRKHNIGREQAYRLASAQFAYKVANDSARKILELARDTNLEIMVFVGNYGALQIHTGAVNKLVEMEGYYNVLDPNFNLHLDESKVASSYVSKKPTVDGIVTSLEIFDSEGETIATFFGKRKPGIPELQGWREIVEKL